MRCRWEVKGRRASLGTGGGLVALLGFEGGVRGRRKIASLGEAERLMVEGEPVEADSLWISRAAAPLPPSTRRLSVSTRPLDNHSARMAGRRLNPVGDAFATLVPVQRAARWRDLPLPRFEGNDAGGAVDRKGKGKAREETEEVAVETWRERGTLVFVVDLAWGADPALADALLLQSFDLYRISPLSYFPLTPSASKASFTAFASSFKTYLDRQTSLEDSPRELGIKRVQAGLVNARLYESTGHPILVEVERGAADGGTLTCLFVLLPSSPSPDSPSYHLLLAHSSSSSLVDSFISYLSTRHDSRITPFRLPHASMARILENALGKEAPSSDMVLTLVFPPSITIAGLSSITLTLPPALQSSLLASPPPSSFLDALSTYIHSLTALSLRQLFITKFSTGEGTSLHSGQGSEGARVKFTTEAEIGRAHV